MEEIKKLLKENKAVIITIVLISILPIYFFGIRPSQIRKQCSQTVKYDSYQYINPEFNDALEKKKSEQLGEYIICRNNNLVEGDTVIVPLNSPYLFNPTEYDNLSYKDKLSSTTEGRMFGIKTPGIEKLVLGGKSPSLYFVYLYNKNGYYIDTPTYKNLKENKDKYLQCNFPDDFVEEKVWGGRGEYKATASDVEYKNCLRNHGLNN